MPRKRPADVADLLRNLAHEPRPKQEPGRDRGWERRQRNDPETTQVSYRGIPRALHAEIKGLAQAQGLTVSEVARALLEIGLAEVKRERRDLP